MATTLDSILTRTPDTCGGRICIDGTRITVHRLAVLCKQGMSPGEIGRYYPHLSLGQIYAALAYYHSNREEIEAELAEDEMQYDRLRGQSEPARTG